MTEEQLRKLLDLSAAVKKAKADAEVINKDCMSRMARATNAVVEASDNLRRYANGIAVKEAIEEESSDE